VAETTKRSIPDMTAICLEDEKKKKKDKKLATNKMYQIEEIRNQNLNISSK
jgi:hypothetical protein